ncbi:extradiol ring-cleavage dioxygenase [Mycobacterium paraseoulense]|uniref:Extradiol ring-cleavage dioxygenase class III enzyme subunit B domain-containing protein n=1 Tax=Mycobacterium paraseoulense TaxID=590652 RepID=A0A1X0I885_9MYCO|nr:extradiol ring-cleavage dioxygenase [Mycobacterium paraseoulense]MCV7393934.1 extradiol ring-cleavage dioxygenase [Mycobacterium paraseoulense]ORB38427.1 hypothetical protein BST39_17210 [Mycobacterium paraseoulense]BBZ70437.1 hypothetical protein MPRS_15300 [Mycobacterium paraseoulense]
MGAVLAAGVTHFPPLALPDERMADVFRWALRDPELPTEKRVPAALSALLAKELADDDGLAAAAAHREELRRHFERVRTTLDEFAPDVVLIWGDDQYELFHEDCVPPFAVCAFDDLETRLWQRPFYKGRPNAWGEPEDTAYPIKGAARAGKKLTTELLGRGFDIAYSYQSLPDRPMPAAFANTLRYLDWDGAGFPYPALFFSINCYGRRLVKHKGGLAYLSSMPKDISELDPPAPSPARCFDLGAAVAEISLQSASRVALVASSSWSHAFLNEASHFLLPDTVRDRELFELLKGDKPGAWRDVTLEEVERAGQHEMLNWFCLAGAVDQLGVRPNWLTMVESDLFTSNKVFGVYDVAGGN